MEISIKATDFQNDTIILGIDEAGRGPVLGPMVYACCYFSKDNEDLLKKRFKFADSKKLNDNQRKEIFNKMKENLHILK
jgi:ribonuclease H2 subunit A